MAVTVPLQSAGASSGGASSVSPVVVPLIYAATNSIRNPSAETNTTGYTTVGATLTRLTTDAKYGTASAKSTIVGTAQSLLFPANTTAAVPVVPGELVFMRAAIKRIDPGNAFTSVPSLRWRAWNAALTVLNAQVSMGADTTAPGIWEELAGLVAMPPNAVYGSPVAFLQGSTAGTTYELRADGFMVVKNPLSFSSLATETMDVLPNTVGWVTPVNGSVAGFVTQGSGVWVPADTAAHSMVNPNFGAPTDCRLTFRFRTGSTIHTQINVNARSLTDFTNNRLSVQLLNDRIRVTDVVANVGTTLVTGTTGITFATNTDYSLQMTLKDNFVTGTVWQGDPVTGTLVGSVSWVLSGVPTLMSGVSGYVGPGWQCPTDYQFYDFKLETATGTLPAYFDGDSLGAYWAGTAHASESVMGIQSQAVSAATLSLTSPALITLNAAATSAGNATVTTGAPIIPTAASATSAAALEVTAASYITFVSSASSAGSLAVTTPATFTFIASAYSNATILIAAPVYFTLSSSAATSSGRLPYKIRPVKVSLTNGPNALVYTGDGRPKISKINPYDVATMSWAGDGPYDEYVVTVVPSMDALYAQAAPIPATAGSVNVHGTSAYSETDEITTQIEGGDLESASPGDGDKVVKVFVRVGDDGWSE